MSRKHLLVVFCAALIVPAAASAASGAPLVGAYTFMAQVDNPATLVVDTRTGAQDHLFPGALRLPASRLTDIARFAKRDGVRVLLVGETERDARHLASFAAAQCPQCRVLEGGAQAYRLMMRSGSYGL